MDREEGLVHPIYDETDSEGTNDGNATIFKQL